jgi:hypothetical protein
VGILQVWRLRAHHYRLEGGVCLRCGSKVLPRREVCPQCQAEPCVGIPVEIVSSIPLFERRVPVPIAVRVRPPHSP